MKVLAGVGWWAMAVLLEPSVAVAQSTNDIVVATPGVISGVAGAAGAYLESNAVQQQQNLLIARDIHRTSTGGGRSSYQLYATQRSASRAANAAARSFSGSILDSAGRTLGLLDTGVTLFKAGDDCWSSYQVSNRTSNGSVVSGCAGSLANAGVELGVSGLASAPVSGALASGSGWLFGSQAIAYGGVIGPAFAAGWSIGKLGQEVLSAVTGKPTLQDQVTDWYFDMMYPPDPVASLPNAEVTGIVPGNETGKAASLVGTLVSDHAVVANARLQSAGENSGTGDLTSQMTAAGSASRAAASDMSKAMSMIGASALQESQASMNSYQLQRRINAMAPASAAAPSGVTSEVDSSSSQPTQQSRPRPAQVQPAPAAPAPRTCLEWGTSHEVRGKGPTQVCLRYSRP